MLRAFPSVFDEEDVDMADDKTNMDDVEDGLQSNFQQAYGWFSVVNRITENDITKHEVVFKKSLVEVLNQLSYLSDFDKELTRQQRQQNNIR